MLVICVLSLIRSLIRAARAWRAASAAAAAATGSAQTALAAAAAGQDVVLACRDDGALARWTGRWLLGNLMPLPPAVAGLTAILLLTWVGIGSLPGVVALTPVVVLLLAAPGASHPHDGRFDWLVPALLCLGQYSFLAAFGLAREVPGPVIFAACAITSVWYAGLVASSTIRSLQPRPAERPATATARQPQPEPAPVLASRKQRIKQIIAGTRRSCTESAGTAGLPDRRGRDVRDHDVRVPWAVGVPGRPDRPDAP